MIFSAQGDNGKTLMLAAAGMVAAFVVVLLVFSIIPGLGKLSVPALTQKPVAVTEEVFPDAALRDYVSVHFDQNSDGYLSVAEITAVNSIGSYDQTTYKVIDEGLSGASVSSLKGIEVFKNLESIVVQDNKIVELDLSVCPSLRHVDMRGNPAFAISYTKANVGAQVLVSEELDSLSDLTDIEIVKA